MTGLGIHHVDTYQYLLGPISRVVVFAARQILKELEIDDSSGILFEFASGALGYLGTAMVLANRTSVIAVHGTEAQAFNEADGSRLFLQRKGESERSPVPIPPVDIVVDELAEFARCIREGGRPEVGGEEGTASVAVLEAIIESAKSGRSVRV
jgi:predicted dehydrogenase